MPHHIGRTLAWVGLLGLSIACASSGPPPGRSAVEGTVRALPRAGIDAGASGGSYGDRRLRNVTLVDYDRPGFSVVYVEEAPGNGKATQIDARLSIRDGRLGPRIGPTEAAGSVGSAIRISNASRAAHIVSVPSLGFVGEVPSRAVLEVGLDSPGPHRLFLLDAPDAQGLVFAAPGPFAVVSSTGRFELDDLEPGAHRLHVWHPRLPPTATAVELAPGVVTHAELTLGVGHSEDAHAPLRIDRTEPLGPAEIAP